MPMLGASGAASAKGFGFGGGVKKVDNIELLMVAGGGGGARSSGGGGGAGGQLYVASQAVTAGISYTITVGAGGAEANKGSNSTAFSQTAQGGGLANGGSGGSGGGGNKGSGSPGGAGTAGQGNNGADGTRDVYAGGGGGAGSAGAANAGGSGSSTYTAILARAQAGVVSGPNRFIAGGGGGGSGGGGEPAGPGGIGGGGAGRDTNVNGISGTANTGGGGGGGTNNNDYSAGGGGSGLVIIQYPDTFPAATATTGSPTVYLTGGYRVYKFTGSGSITF